ncbi:uncharacterized protein HMPREF1541_05202 [Cyphellophora europaea CBS 101466]|uniref:Uncharacterized protein n=1 Tax=Cyphellophora europaea (strain CBS 101466) TaxID=1220924 RepID=W2RWX9_CYPE1|nr:uncharacterized protein HMPREF1541_05202 [Cyphellophora europaea CBS 101466]ETN40922.1 hypothetical protein HMPREF1541_05202 [Cyphellophora europaea CBS 101466]
MADPPAKAPSRPPSDEQAEGNSISSLYTTDTDIFPLPLPTLTTTPIRHHHSCLALSITLISHLTQFLRRHFNHAATDEDQPPPRPARRHRGHGLFSIGSGTGVLEALLLKRCQDEQRQQQRQQQRQKQDRRQQQHGQQGGERRQQQQQIQVFGVEVPAPHGDRDGTNGTPHLNRYLRACRRVVVGGTWDVLGPAEAEARFLGEEVRYGGSGGGSDSGGGARDDGHEGNEDRESEIGAEGSSGVDADLDVDMDMDMRVESGVDVALLFVYPRQPTLLQRYLDAWLGVAEGMRSTGTAEDHESERMGYNRTTEGRSRRVNLTSLVWAGPRVDWADYEGIFRELQVRGWVVEERWGAEVGVAEGEGVVAAAAAKKDFVTL